MINLNLRLSGKFQLEEGNVYPTLLCLPLKRKSNTQTQAPAAKSPLVKKTVDVVSYILMYQKLKFILGNTGPSLLSLYATTIFLIKMFSKSTTIMLLFLS